MTDFFTDTELQLHIPFNSNAAQQIIIAPPNLIMLVNRGEHEKPTWKNCKNWKQSENEYSI